MNSIQTIKIGNCHLNDNVITNIDVSFSILSSADDSIPSCGAVKQYVNDAISNQDGNYTLFEVFPTNIPIPANTKDSLEDLGSLFNWDVNDSSVKSQFFTGLDYIEDVEPRSDLHIQLYSHVLQKDSDIHIDWGDGTYTDVKNDPNVLYDDENSINWKSLKTCNIRIYHDYLTTDSCNMKHIVKIYGCRYDMVRFYETDKENPARSIVSRIFDFDLPIAANVLNVSSICRGSSRILKVTYPYMQHNSIKNYVGSFMDCINLQEVDFDDSIFAHGIYAGNHMFDGCINLRHSTVKLPNNVETYGIEGFYSQCSNLTGDISSFFPKCGFSCSQISISQLFHNCSNLSGEVPSKILWDSPVKFTSTQFAFAGCSEEITKQVPYSWANGYGQLPNRTIPYEYSKVVANASDVNRFRVILDKLLTNEDITNILRKDTNGMTFKYDGYYISKDTGEKIELADYKWYEFIANNDFDLWIDPADANSQHFMLGIYNGLATSENFIGPRYYTDTGNMPTEDNPAKIQRGQTLVVVYHSSYNGFQIRTNGTALINGINAKKNLPLSGKTIDMSQDIYSVIKDVIHALGGETIDS